MRPSKLAFAALCLAAAPVLAQGLPSHASGDPTADELRDRLGDVVLTGFAMSENELFDGSVALAAPVFREDGIVGAITLIGPAFRCGPEWRAKATGLLQAGASTINAGLSEDRP